MSHRSRWLLGACGLLALLSACASASGDSSTVGVSAPTARPTGPLVLPLTSDGWKPGDLVEAAETDGKFHAVIEGSHACAWVGDERRSMLWPSGWHVRFGHPVQLLDQHNHVVANEGQELSVGGGSWDGSSPCGSDPPFAAEVAAVTH